MAFIGVNGTGKSTMMRNYLPLNKRNVILPSNMMDAGTTWGNFPKLKPIHSFENDPYDHRGKRKNIVFKISNVRTFTGTKLIDIGVFREGEHKQAFFKSICDANRQDACLTNAGMFVDDTKNYILTKGDLPSAVTSWLVNRRHLMIDIFLAFHAFQDVNAQLIQYGLKFMLFKTDLPPNDTVRNKIACWDDLLEMRAYVNQKAKTDPYYWEPFDPVDKEANAIWRKHYRR